MPSAYPPVTLLSTQIRLLQSSIVDYTYRLHIGLPTNYARSGVAYPVVYLTDGNTFFPLAWSIAQTLSADWEIPQGSPARPRARPPPHRRLRHGPGSEAALHPSGHPPRSGRPIPALHPRGAAALHQRQLSHQPGRHRFCRRLLWRPVWAVRSVPPPRHLRPLCHRQPSHPSR
jgi:hypothetical protein